MINIKATKSAGPGTDPASRYRVEEKKPSGLPFAIGGALAGIAFYLRDLFPSWGISLPEAEPEPAGTDEPVRPSVVAGFEPRPVRQSDDAPMETGQPAEAGAGSSAVPAPTLEPAGLPRLAMTVTSFGGGVDSAGFGFANEVRGRAANDNGPPAAPSQPRSLHAISASEPAAVHPGDDDGTGRQVDEAPVDNDDRPSDDDDSGDEDADGLDGDDDTQRANRAPVVTGPVQLWDVFGCSGVLIALSDLLRSASDPDGDALSVRNLTVNSGTLARADDGWLFDPAALGSVVFTYQITDGDLAILQTARLTVREAPPVNGSPGADIIVGTECADRIDAGAGDDIVDARGGSDIVVGGAGRDRVVAGTGDDIVFGSAGDDVIFGGHGDDRLWGGDGDDRLFGESGDDVLHGDAGNDLMFGGAGDDIAFGGSGDDVVHGEAGDDLIEGEAGDDHLTGGAGNDSLFGGGGSDLVEGNDGNDLLGGGDQADRVSGGGGDDVVIGDVDRADDVYLGGEGLDTLDYSAADCAIDADLAAATASGAGIGEDTIDGFEVFVAGSGDDRIADGGSATVIRAAGGDDVVVAAADGDDDVYDGGAGCDTIDYQAVADPLVADLGAGTVEGGTAGSDRVRNFEVFLAGSGDDTITGSDAAETLHGNDGDDRIAARGGDDVIHDGAGADSVAAGPGDDVVEAAADGAADAYDGGPGTDTLSYAATMSGVTVDLKRKTATGIEIGRDTIDGFEAFVGGGGDDTFRVHGGAASFRGGAGDDLFDFSLLAGPDAATGAVYEILDFVVGDRIRLSKYEIFEKVVDTLEDRFEAVYGEDLDEDDMPIRIRHERSDEMRRTYVEADMDRDDHYELGIRLDGHHMLMVIEQA